MFDLEIEAVAVGGGGGEDEIFTPTLTLLLIFNRRSPSCQPTAAIKIKEGGHNCR